MAGVRRRLRDITTRVSGAIVGPRDGAAAAPVSDTGPAGDDPAPTPAEERDVSPPTAVEVGPDALSAAAVELARAVAVEAGGTAVGAHQGAEADGPLVVTHSFASTDPAYVGWRWAVTVTRADGSDEVTVDEVVLLPGSGALVAPAWVPWSDRVQPGDLAPGDLLPPGADDLRIVPAYSETEAELASVAFWELGLGRPRVLSVEGRLEAADRWYDGDGGPAAPRARQAPGRCADCAFQVGLSGALRSAFGVCANGQAPDDGRVVSLDHGCGAHSEQPVETASDTGPGMVVEDEEFELVPVAVAADAPGPEVPGGDASSGGASAGDVAAETPDGHAS